MMRKRALFIRGQLGFSLVEVIVVVAIMAVLGTVLGPQFLRYVNQNRATACQVDREGILAVYERCIYEETKELTTTDLDNVMNGLDAATQNEIHQFDKCPLNGTYVATVVGNVAMITCDCDGHEEVVVDFAAWDGTELAEGIDEPFTQPPVPSTPEPSDTPTEEPPTSEAPPVEDSYWPYEESDRWDGQRHLGGSVEIAVPSGIFTSREGNDYVVVDREGDGTFAIQWMWRKGPEYRDTNAFEGIIGLSGVVISEEALKGMLNDAGQIPGGIYYGDIVIVNGKKYVYGSLTEATPIDPPKEGVRNNFWPIE